MHNKNSLTEWYLNLLQLQPRKVGCSYWHLYILLAGIDSLQSLPHLDPCIADAPTCMKQSTVRTSSKDNCYHCDWHTKEQTCCS